VIATTEPSVATAAGYMRGSVTFANAQCRVPPMIIRQVSDIEYHQSDPTSDKAKGHRHQLPHHRQRNPTNLTRTKCDQMLVPCLIFYKYHTSVPDQLDSAVFLTDLTQRTISQTREKALTFVARRRVSYVCLHPFFVL